MAWRDDAIRDLVTRTLLGESDKTPEGMASVAHVIKNRADSGAWGDRTSGGLTHAITADKQFSMWNKGDPKLEALAASVNAIPTSDPRYQRAAAIADGVFGDQISDNTGGATHYHTPDVSPSWAAGQTPTATIGGHYFYKLPLTASNTAGTAVTGPSSVGMGSASAPAAPTTTGPSSAPSDADANDARQYLAGLSAHPDRAGDTANMNPVFATQLASAIKQARAAGLPITVYSGFREPGQTGTSTQAGRYDAGGNSSHSYGLATDVGGLDGPNGKITQAWAQIAQANGLHNPYGVGDTNEYNHWQLPEKPLEQTPELLAALKTAKATGDFNNVWSAYNSASPQSLVPNRQTYPPVASPGPVNPNAPAINAQPVAATAPGSSGGNFAVPSGGSSAGFVGPGSDKYSVVQGMTTGTSHNPQLTTAANWGNLFGGGGSPSSPPAAAPAAASPPQPASAPKPFQPTPVGRGLNPSGNLVLSPGQGAGVGQSVPVPLPPTGRPLDTSYGPQQSPGNAWNQRPSGVAPSIASAPLPPERPLTLPTLNAGDFNAPAANPSDVMGSSVTMGAPAHVPVWGPWHAGGAPSGPIIASPPSAQTPSSILSNWGAANPVNPDAMPNTGGVPGGGVTGRAPMTAGAPSMGFPAMSQPPAQISQLPGSMMASAQNLIKLLFPSNVG